MEDKNNNTVLRAQGLLWGGTAVVLLLALVMLMGDLNTGYTLPPTWIPLTIMAIIGVVLLLIKRRRTAWVFIILAIVLWPPTIMMSAAEWSHLTKPDAGDFITGLIIVILPGLVATVLYIIGAAKNLKTPKQAT